MIDSKKQYGALTLDDIIGLYVTSKDKDKEIFILAQLTASDAETIIEVNRYAETANGIKQSRWIEDGCVQIQTATMWLIGRSTRTVARNTKRGNYHAKRVSDKSYEFIMAG